MKKTYIAPKAQMIELDCEALMVNPASFGVDTTISVDEQYESESRSVLWGED